MVLYLFSINKILSLNIYKWTNTYIYRHLHTLHSSTDKISDWYRFRLDKLLNQIISKFRQEIDGRYSVFYGSGNQDKTNSAKTKFRLKSDLDYGNMKNIVPEFKIQTKIFLNIPDFFFTRTNSSIQIGHIFTSNTSYRVIT